MSTRWIEIVKEKSFVQHGFASERTRAMEEKSETIQRSELQSYSLRLHLAEGQLAEVIVSEKGL